MRIVRYVDRDGAIGHATADAGGGYSRLKGDPVSGFRTTTEPVAVQRLLAPVVPPAILGIGLNYRRHAAESGLPVPERLVMFMKAPGAVQDPDRPILLPTCLKSDEVDYECELAVVIGRTCKNVAPERALDYVLGYTCANDVSARDWQIKKGGGQWCRGKTFDTFCPLGPCIVTTDEIPDPNALGIRTFLNGQAVQDWTTNDMVFDVKHLIAFLSGSTTLHPGTVILTGTPHGVGMAAQPPRWLRDGDEVVVEIDQIGRLANPVQVEVA
jgi:2-keto-4-pentenoate hydratase/2-oxohepta-3-ene-1,7-dioic acid hydratase in catechol pathway